MKKGLLFLVFGLGLVVGARAQNWALPSSTWLTTYFWMSPPSFGTIKVEKDTLVDGIVCQKLGKYVPLYTYSFNDTVYFFFDGRFRSMYYFNANIGDTVSYWNTYLACTPRDTIIKAVVVGIDSIVLSNQTLRSFHTKIVRDSTGLTVSVWADTVTYTEKIGSNYIYPRLYPNCLIDGDSYGICDYGDSTITGFYAGLNQGCLTGIPQSAIQNPQFEIHPNPATTTVTITTPEGAESATLTVTDLTGRVVLNPERVWNPFGVAPKTVVLSTGNLPNGIYLVTLTCLSGRQAGAGGASATKKLIIQN